MTFLPLIPDGWIREYLTSMRDSRNEMPLPFHFLAACVVIGQVMGLETWATLAKGVRVYPNVNAMLLSPAGKCRRGEGTKITTKIAREAGVNLISGKATPEGLVLELKENGNLLLYSEELSTLLTKQEYQRPIIAVLTKLLLHGDGPADVVTVKRGKEAVEYVNLSALFTSAPDWFMTTIPEEAFGGGLMSRFLVCCLEDRDVYHIDICADDEGGKALMSQLAKTLPAATQSMRGHVKGTRDAQRWIEKWYLANERGPVEDERALPHRNRKPANLLRLAMILGASAGETKLTRELLESSLAILDWLEPTMLKLFGITDAVVSDLNRGEKRIIRRLAKVPDMLHSDLARACSPYFRNVREMRFCMEGLVEKAVIKPIFRNGAFKPWPPLGWTLVKEGKDGDEGSRAVG